MADFPQLSLARKFLFNVLNLIMLIALFQLDNAISYFRFEVLDYIIVFYLKCHWRPHIHVNIQNILKVKKTNL